MCSLLGFGVGLRLRRFSDAGGVRDVPFFLDSRWDVPRRADPDDEDPEDEDDELERDEAELDDELEEPESELDELLLEDELPLDEPFELDEAVLFLRSLSLLWLGLEVSFLLLLTLAAIVDKFSLQM